MAAPTTPAREAARLGRALERKMTQLRQARKRVKQLEQEARAIKRDLQLWITSTDQELSPNELDSPTA